MKKKTVAYRQKGAQTEILKVTKIDTEIQKQRRRQRQGHKDRWRT